MDDLRRTIVVCGVWEDTENLNVFLQSLQNDEVRKDFVVACYTFGRSGEKDARVNLEMEFAETIGRLNPAAIILFPEMLKTKVLIDKLYNIGISLKVPVFSVERELAGCINLVPDYDGAFRKMCEHVVIEHGCRKIDMFAGYIDNDYSNRRIELFEQVLSENGIDPITSNIYYGDFWDVPARNLMNDLLDNGYQLPEAIVCANDSMAIGVSDALLAHGHKVPQDVIITGFDGTWQGQYHNPSLTTCKPDYTSATSKMIEIISNWTDDQVGRTERITVNYEYMINNSCGCKIKTPEEYAGLVSLLAEENHDYFTHSLEMGRFLTRTVSIYDLDEATKNFQDYLWMWKKQYYFIAIEEGPGTIHGLFYGNNGEYKYRQHYYGLHEMVPDKSELAVRGGLYNVFLLRQIRSTEKSFGYVVCGYPELSMRDQQRFEEMGFYVSTMVNTVVNNNELIQANIAIEKMSENDYLTGLYNRRGFFKKIDKIVKNQDNQGKYLTYFSVDMDGLKSINDTYGHQDGDIAINALANAIRRYISGSGECARYGGDEFAFCLVEDVPSSMAIAKIRNALETFIDNDVSVMGKPYKVRASIGASTWQIGEGFNLEELINQSDKAMYHDKMSRK